jgi:hypothetical protein
LILSAAAHGNDVRESFHTNIVAAIKRGDERGLTGLRPHWIWLLFETQPMLQNGGDSNS